MVRETFQRFRSQTTVETALKSQTERPCTFWVWTWRSCLRRGEKSDSFIELTMWFWQSDKSWIESDCAWYTSMIHFYAPPRCNMVAHGHRGTNYRCFGPTSPLVGLHFHSTSRGCLKQMPKAGDGIAHGVATALTGGFRGMHVTLEEEKRAGEGRWNSIRSPENSKSLWPISFQSSSTTTKNACLSMFQLVVLSRLSHPVFSWNVWTLWKGATFIRIQFSNPIIARSIAEKINFPLSSQWGFSLYVLFQHLGSARYS